MAFYYLRDFSHYTQSLHSYDAHSLCSSFIQKTKKVDYISHGETVKYPKLMSDMEEVFEDYAATHAGKKYASPYPSTVNRPP
jgi:hypothetical protein